jgi:hypothetical protein
MGMYTEFHFNSELIESISNDTIQVLRYMLHEIDSISEIPTHSLFDTDRWRFMLVTDSYYFDADTHSSLRHDYLGGWYLCIRCNLKNYCSEIEKFIDWIKPYLYKQPGDFLGFYRYEETEEPTLIYMS